jgi:hypothetical protein
MEWVAGLIPPAKVLVGGVSVKWHPCILAEVSPHDGPAPGGATFDVKRDNNLAHRNITLDEPGDSDGDFAVGVVAGTVDAPGVDAILLDRSLLARDCRVFARVADEGHMRNWVELVRAGEFLPGEPLPGSPREAIESVPVWPEKGTRKARCTVTLLDPSRLGIDCCDGNSIVIHAPAQTRIELLCRGRRPAFGRPNVKLGTYQGQQVVFFDGGSEVLVLPLRLAAREFIPVVLGLARPHGKRVMGELKATQLRGDGELSPGYSIEG